MIATVFYLCSFLVCFLGFFRYRKTRDVQDGVTGLALTGILIACYEAFLAAVLNLIRIPVNLWSLGCLCLAAGLFFWYRQKKTGETQQYAWSRFDVVLSAALLIVVLVLAHYRWGLMTLDWSYRTVDPAARYREAMEYINNAGISRMFFAQLLNGTTMELFTPFLRYDYYYKLYVLSDILQLALSGLMFYGAAKHLSRGAKEHPVRRHLTAIICTFFFLLGYPLNSTLYGFTYLGMSLYLLAAILVVTDLFLSDDDTERWLFLVLLMILMHAIFQCYLLFMPVTYLAVGLSILLKQKQKGVLFSKETLVTGLSIFVLPIVFGLLYTYMDVFVNDNVTVGSAIAAEGSIYRDLYSNFVFFLPAAVFGLIALYRKKKNTFLSWFTPLFFIFVLGMFYLSLFKGKVSAYYYFKDYYPLWLIVFLLIVYALSECDSGARKIVYGILGSWCFCAIMFVSGAEFNMQANSGLFVPDRKSERYNDLIAFNLETIRRPHYSDAKMELMHYVYENLLHPDGVYGPEDGGKQVPVCSTEEETYLYESVTGQRLKDFEFWRSRENDIQYFINVKNDCDYVCVFTDCPLYEVHEESFWDGLSVVYANEAGFIAAVN